MTDFLKNISRVNWFIRRFPLLYKSARFQIERYEDMDLHQRQAYQRSRLAPLLVAAGYRADQPLDTIAMMDKADVRANPGRYRQKTSPFTARARTSGTNGEPMEVARSFRSIVFEQAAIDWVVSQAGFDLSRDRVATLRATRVLGIGKGEQAGTLRGQGRILQLPTNDLSPETFPAFMAALEAFKPKILHVMPGAMDYLADLMIERGRTMAIPLVLASSEMLTASIRAKIETVFGATCIDYYGQAERVGAAYSLKPGQFRFLGSYGAIELARSGEAWEIVGTSLHNRAQTLIRYRTGDLIRCQLPEADIPAIALGLLPFGGIEGRRDDALVGRDGRRFVAMNYVPRELAGYGRFQFIQERPNQATIQLAGWSPEAREHPELVVERARIMVPEDFEIDVRFVQKLERTPAGKTPFILRRF